MRSLLLASSFAPALGGIETLLYQTARRLTEPPLVLAPAPAAAPDVNVHGVQLNPRARAAYRPLWAVHPSLHYVQAYGIPALRAANAWKPGVILAGHIYMAPLAWVLARRLGLPFVVYAYGQEVWRDGRAMGLKPVDWQLRGGALRAADRVLVPGSFTAGLLEAWAIDAARVVEIPYGAEARPLAPPPRGKTVLSVARLVSRKGIDTMIQALRLLPADLIYRVVGNGPDADRLRALAVAEGVADRVHFLGRLDDRSLAEEYRRCTLFVLPARRTAEGDLEGYGLVYFEAAAWGRPVVAGCSGGEVDAVVDGVTGVLVDGESPRAVAQAIGDLLADPARLESLGAAGRDRVQSTHNWTRAATAIDAALSSIGGNRR